MHATAPSVSCFASCSEDTPAIDCIDASRRAAFHSQLRLLTWLQPSVEFNVAFELPWPWGGERFELCDIRPINYIVGPLGSGKTRLAQRLAEALPDAAFLGWERLECGGAAAILGS